MKKIKILTVNTTGLEKKEGISTVILDYFKRFDKNRFQIDIVSAGECCPELKKEFSEAEMTIRVLPPRREHTFGYILGFMRLFRQEQYDALYIHGSSAMMSIELGLAKLCGCKVRIAHSHNTTSDHKRVDKLLRPLFDCLYTHAFACGTEAGKWLFGQQEFQVIKNGRDVERYRFNPAVREQMRLELGLENTTLAIGHVGNFNAQKNQQYALEVFAELRKRRPDSRMFLVGDGSTKKQMEQKSKDLGLFDAVVFTGSVSNVPDMLQAMDVMLLPSLHEGLPLVVVEWQIAALPCILSDKVTRECAYTDLVSFLPLEKPAVWAEKLLQMVPTDRAAAADTVVELTREHGFDINSSSKDLEQFFIAHCKGK